MAIYDDYAPFYDGSGQIRFALLTAHYLDEVLGRHPPPSRAALDVACGTGTLAVALAEEGWQVLGIDQSPAMVALARAKASAAGVANRASFAVGDMRALEPRAKNQEPGTKNQEPGSGISAIAEPRRLAAAPVVLSSQPSVLGSRFGLVTCTYDSLNYLLTEAELAAFFRGAAAALSPGGLLYADMNTRHFLEHDWPACELDERPGLTQISQSRFDPATETSTMRLTGFAGDDERGYARFDETHVERAYPPETVAALIAAAGLDVEAAYEGFTFQQHHPRSQRIAWVARRMA